MTDERLCLAVALLPLRLRKVFLFHAVIGLAFYEIGEVMGMSRARAWQLWEEALERIVVAGS